jgi:hypothetical protein
MTVYDPEKWLESATRCLKEYAEQEFNRAVHEGSEPVGQYAYEIVMEFPGTTLDNRKIPMRRTIIHFEIDDIVSRLVGIGDNIYRTNFDAATSTVTPQDAMVHQINFDVGIWASDASGGTTSRARAKQILMNAFGGAHGFHKLGKFSDGGDGELEIIQFSGGRFMMDRINDLGVYRSREHS